MTQTLEAPAALPQNTPPPAPAPFAATFNRNELAAALAALAPCVAARGRMPILACVKLTAAADGVALEATNRELWASRRVAMVQTESAGSVLVSHEDLKTAVDKLTADTVSVRREGDGVRVEDDSFGYSLSAAAVEDFPPALKGDGNPAGTLAAKGLARLVKQTDAARSELAKQGSNAVMAGFWLSTTEERIRVTASDGKRLHDAYGQWAGEPLEPSVLPAMLMAAAVAMAGEEGGVGLSLTGGRATFAGDGWELSGPLVEGRPASVDDVIPKDCPCTATANREELLARFKQAAALMKEDPWLKCEWDLRGLTLSPARAAAAGRGRSIKPVPLRYAGEPLTIGLNAGNLIDALSAADTTEVEIGLTAANRPILVTAGESLRCVAMPVNLAT